MFERRVPAARFTRIGDEVEGEIVNVRRTQHTEHKTNIALYWEKHPGTGKSTIVKQPVNAMTGLPNDPKMQWEITLDTGMQDENGYTEKRLFVRGKRMDAALEQAVQSAAPREGLLLGGRLSCKWSGTEPSAGGGQDAKLYEFRYVPPAAGEGRRPDTTPILAASTWTQQLPPSPAPAFAPGGHVPAPVPAFPLRQQEQRPVVAPYAGPSYAPAATPNYDDEPPF